MHVSEPVSNAVKSRANDSLQQAEQSYTRWICGLGPVLLIAAGCGSGTPAAQSPGGSVEVEGVQTAATSEVAPAGTTPVEDDDESIADLKEHHRHHHHGGFAMFVAMSLDSLGTPAGSIPAPTAATPDQRAAITKIQADMRAKMRPAHDAEKKLLSTLADGITMGNIDKAGVEGAIEQLSTAAAGVNDAVADSLNQLHATLTPPQRAALVDKVEANFEVWNDVNSTDESAGWNAHDGQLGRLTTELGLSTSQVATILGTLTSSTGSVRFDRKEGDEHLHAFGKAFASDAFDARTLTTGGSASAHIATWGAMRMARIYEAVNPVLTIDQRAKLAQLLRQNANYTQTGT
jgi:Spy/CpxP family protein refolding chaperone